MKRYITGDIIYRKMYTGEEEKVSEMVIESFNEFIAPDFSEEGIHEFLGFVEPSAIRMRRREGNLFLLAVVCSEIIGMIEMRSLNHVSLLFVNKAYQRRGIAATLMQKAVDYAVEMDDSIRFFDVNSSLYAVEIYRRLGFKEVDDVKELKGIRFIPMVMELQERQDDNTGQEECR